MAVPRQIKSAQTESICPTCLKAVAAEVVTRGDTVFLEKTCVGHGSWSEPLWRGAPAYDTWQRPKEPARPEVCYAPVKDGCPFDCGLCAEHRQYPCSVLLEVTQRCTLGCPVCFADSTAENGTESDPDIATISGWYDRVMAAAGPCNIQLSGGEPTLRNDLPEIIALGKSKGFPFIQLNSNGLRLAEEAGYAKSLAEAGLTTVFLQFDGTNDQIHTALRGRPLASVKEQAVKTCGAAGLGVVLVPTLVPGVNTDNIGEIIRFAFAHLPLVRGVHFQPASNFGRYAMGERSYTRFTLPEVMQAIEAQTDGLMRVGDFLPPGGENARCSFHGSFFVLPDGRLRRISPESASCCSSKSGHAALLSTIGSVARQWAAPSERVAADTPCCGEDGVMDLDTFLDRATNYSLSISCMVFQDAWNLDLERLRDCCISVMSPVGQLVPFCAYNLTSESGERLYRNRKEAAP
ncbi:MAG: radical SAM (seleno)protein TrsS [Desulfuromonadales bacterium]